jgi:hypothetical protein
MALQVFETMPVPYNNMFLMTCVSIWVQQNRKFVEDTQLLGSTREQVQFWADLFEVEYTEAKMFFKSVSTLSCECLFVVSECGFIVTYRRQTPT